jgi:predicted transcriptional regulator
MPTLKDLTIEVLNNLPPSASLEEIMYKVNLAAQVMQGLKDAEQDRVISTGELLNRIDSWGR